jgi:hypothetical protein
MAVDPSEDALTDIANAAVPNNRTMMISANLLE